MVAASRLAGAQTPANGRKMDLKAAGKERPCRHFAGRGFRRRNEYLWTWHVYLIITECTNIDVYTLDQVSDKRNQEAEAALSSTMDHRSIIKIFV